MRTPIVDRDGIERTYRVLVAVGGGGLIGGVAAAYSGAVRVIGVEPTGASTLSRALAAGTPVDAPPEASPPTRWPPAVSVT